MRLPAILAAVGCITLAQMSVAQGIGSLSDLDIEFTEAKLALEAARAENEALTKRNKLLEDNIRVLSASLAQANTEAELFRREFTDIKLRNEALGLESVGTDKSKLEQRLLKLVRDMQVLETEKERISEQLVQISEAVLRFLKDAESVDPQSRAQARAELEAQLRGSAAALGYANAPLAEAVPVTLSDAMVMSLREEIGLVVINVGAKSGVKLGMPFRVIRDGETVGTVQVINVREEISGAVTQDLSSTKTKIKVGDRLRVDAR